MQTEHSPFPTDETLAAYIDGRLDKETRKRVVEHMAECPECFDVVMGGREIAGRDVKAVVAFRPARVAVLSGIAGRDVKAVVAFRPARVAVLSGLAAAATIVLAIGLTPMGGSLL